MLQNFKIHIFFFTFFLGCVFTVAAQHPNVMIGNQNYPNEPSIAIDPKNTNRLVAGANINNYYFSEDGGLTWQHGSLSSSLYGVWGDPVLLVDTSGNYYFFHLSWPASGNWIDRIVCQKSIDGGQNWNVGTYMGLNGTKAQDKHWTAVNRNNNHIFSTWTQFDQYGSSYYLDSTLIFFSKSTDAGETWSPALRISEKGGNCVDSDLTVEGAVPCIGPDGEIFVSWAGPQGIVFDRSFDEGATWLDHDIFVNENPGGWDLTIPGLDRSNGMPVTCCDISTSPYRGTIYINFADQRNGADDTDIWLVKSTDQGNTWSEPVRVNDDPAGKHQFLTWMTIDQVTGYLYFVFYDRRNYNDNNTDVFMAVSKDGGQTFNNFKVSESPFVPFSSAFFGDYNNITAHNNVVRPIWTRFDNGQASVWTAIIDANWVSSPAGGSIFDERHDLEQNFPNPFTGSTTFAFKIRKNARVTLSVYDVFGTEISRLIDHEKLSVGKYTHSFDPSSLELVTGVYYFSLITDDLRQIKKMTYVR